MLTSHTYRPVPRTGNLASHHVYLYFNNNIINYKHVTIDSLDKIPELELKTRFPCKSDNT